MSIQVVSRKKWFHVTDVKNGKSFSDKGGIHVIQEVNETHVTQNLKKIEKEVYTVYKETPLFLDYHALSLEKRKEIFEWGVIEGYLVQETNWVYLYQSEGESAYKTFSSYQAWLDYEKTLAETQLSNLSNAPARLVKEIIRFHGSDSLYNRSGWLLQRFSSVSEMLCVMRYAEEVLAVDGVYWSGMLELHPEPPYAIIFQSKIIEWTVEPITNKSVC